MAIQKWDTFLERMWREHRTLSLVILILLGVVCLGAIVAGAWVLLGAVFGPVATGVAPTLAKNLIKARHRRLEDDKRERDLSTSLKRVDQDLSLAQDKLTETKNASRREEDDAKKKVDAMDDSQRNAEFSRLASEFRKNP